MAEDKSNGNDPRWMMALVLIIGLPMIFVWLFLAFLIIKGAIDSEAVLGDIENLLLGLAVLTLPVQKIVDKVMDKWLDKS
jgi:hypothetical protein|tara:strand:+ start:3272 stop:3511 length:240 start_codon:yes stop_codon:yes gene_type:complete